MAYTLQQSVNYAQTFVNYLPLSAQTGSEPAITIGNMVVSFMLNPPFTWPTNRKEDTSLTTTAGTQDYTLSITDFGFLETVTLTDANNKSFAVPKIYNSSVLGLSSEQAARPNSACVKIVTPGTSIAIRFLSAPDAIYTGVCTYQKVPVLFSLLTQDWFTQCNIPVYYMDIFNNLFLAEAFQVNDDARAGLYRQRGMAALISKSEGLSEMTKNMLMQQAMISDLQTISAQIRTQQAQQARAT